MKKILILLIILLCATYANAIEVIADKGMEKYIPLVKKEIVTQLEDVYNTRMDACGLFINDEEISNELGYLLGCEDAFKNIRLKVRYAFYDSKVIETTISKVKIFSYEKLKKDKKDKLAVGYIIYTFPNENSVDLTFSSILQEGYEENFFLPILVDKEGKIIKQKEIIDGLVALGGNTKVKAPLMLLDIVDEIQNEILKIKYPFSRWYNDGINYKVTSLILHKQKYEYADEFDKLFIVSDKSKKIKDKVNLLAFTQENLLNALTKDKDLESADIQYSCELMNNFYNIVSREGLHKVNLELKSSPLLTNDQICYVVNQITKCDLYSMLLEYVPKSTKELLDKNKYSSSLKECEKLMEESKYKEAAIIYKSLLEADPYDYNVRLNLAKCYRENKELLLAEEQIFIAANSMPIGQVTINIYGAVDSHFLAVFGKFLYMQGALGEALNFLEKSYELEKAEDVKKVIDSINLTKENMQKELYGGK